MGNMGIGLSLGLPLLPQMIPTSNPSSFP
jgi:hypothetical protein